MTTQFETIYLNQSKIPGRLRVAEPGLGWKANEKNVGGSSVPGYTEPYVLPTGEIIGAYWSRGSRGYEVRVHSKNQGVIQLDGFDIEDLNSVRNTFKNTLSVELETKEHSVKGWNWGMADLGRSELVFSVTGKPAFEVPYSDIGNTNLVGRNEVAVEMNLEDRKSRMRTGDELVELRFYVPGVVEVEKDRGSESEKAKQQGKSEEDLKDESGDSNDDAEDASMDENVVEQSAAAIFYEGLKEKADIGLVAGEAIVSFADILFLTPRGRYDIDMYHTSLRLRGKTYDYKIQYNNIQRLFLLPKPDEIHNMLIIQLDPPLRQGQTRYPFLIIQFLREEEMEVELNFDEEDYEKNYKDKLKRKYDQAAHEVVGQLFRGLTGQRITVPGSYTSYNSQAGVSCSLKANEGYIYPLDKCLLFVPKPVMHIPLVEIAYITFSRVGASTTSRTFDMTVTLRNAAGEHQFSNVDKEEQPALEAYIKSKNIKIRDDAVEEQKRLAAALGDESDASDVEMETVDRGSADEDEESEDEDFQEEDESDIAEEFDENHASNSDESDAGASDGSSSEQKARQTKKSRR